MISRSGRKAGDKGQRAAANFRRAYSSESAGSVMGAPRAADIAPHNGHRSTGRRRADKRLLAHALKVRAAVYEGLPRFRALARPGDLAVSSTGFRCCHGGVFQTVDNRIVAKGEG